MNTKTVLRPLSRGGQETGKVKRNRKIGQHRKSLARKHGPLATIPVAPVGSKHGAEKLPSAELTLFTANGQEWVYRERSDRPGNWDQFRRMIYTRLRCEDGQRKLPFARKDVVIYTNIGQGESIDHCLIQAGKSELLQTTELIEAHHGGGRNELVFRALKDFGTQRLPFQKFFANMAYYSPMLLAYNLYQAFKEDALTEHVEAGEEARTPLTAYATRVRRQKVVRTAGQVILNVTEATARRLDIKGLWRRVADPPQFAWT